LYRTHYVGQNFMLVFQLQQPDGGGPLFHDRTLNYRHFRAELGPTAHFR